MRLLRLSLKNATIKWWRSLTLGFFIFSVSFVMIFSGAFILAARNKVGKVVTNGITGHVQLRSGETQEGDMVVQYSQGWDALEPIPGETVAILEDLVRRNFKGVETFRLTRQYAYLTGNGKREETLLIGLEPGFDKYREAFLLTQGRYPGPDDKDGILLTEEQANTFRARIGDTVTITTKNAYGLNASIDLKVVGIGNFVMLSLFSYKANYTSGDAVRQLLDMEAGEATDLVVFEGDGKGLGGSVDKLRALIQNLAEDLKNSGMKVSLTAEEKTTSEDLQVSDLPFGEEKKKEEGIKISGFDEMGGTFKGISDMMFVLLNLFVLFLFIIVSILIINLVYMTGLERYREIGTLRAIGFSRSQVVRIFMGEILIVSLCSGFLGVLLSSMLVWIVSSLGIASPIPAFDFIMGKTLSLEIDPRSILTNMGILVGFSLAASFYPAYKACSVLPAETIRTV